MPFVTSDGAKIYWRLDGLEGRPGLVLLNSIGLDMDLWDAMLPALRRRFVVLRIDTRGHGASDAPEGDYHLAGLARDVATAMDAAALPRAVIAGVSLGGMIAMQLALDAPERVEGLALICTSSLMDKAAWADRVATVRAKGMEAIADLVMGRFLSPDFVADHPDVAATVRRSLLATATEGYAGCGAAIRDMALADRLAQITAPALIVTGKRDTSTPLQGHGDRLLANLRYPEHAELDAAHLAPLEAPEVLGALLSAFIESRKRSVDELSRA
jgi:3-oxoadipate enol-lactonase